MPTFEKDERLKIQWFILGLEIMIRNTIKLQDPKSIKKAFDLARREEMNLASKRTTSKYFIVSNVG